MAVSCLIVLGISRKGFHGVVMDKILNVLMNLIKAALKKEDMDIEQYRALSQDEEKQLYKLCSTHSIGVIAGDVLGKTNGIEKTPVVKKLMNEAFSSVYRYEQFQIEIGKITKMLAELKIPYIILKGPRVRRYYPEPWLRTSGDIDILVHEEDVDRAVTGLVERYSYEKQERNYHDVPLISPNDVLLELHFNIKENMDNLDRVLIKVWENSAPVDNEGNMEYEQSNEYFMFHLIAHMAYHFQHGGCGIRSVLDIYLIHHKMEYDEEKLRAFCREAEIETFYEYAIGLSEVWFGDQAHTDVTRAMEKYIIHGGTFGTKDNFAAVGQSKNGGHLQYMSSRIFASYGHLKGRYPNLEKHKYLMPFYQVRRWIDMIKKGKLKKYTDEYKLSKNISREQLDSTEKLLKALKLN